MENPKNFATQWNKSCIGSWMNTCEMRSLFKHFRTICFGAFFSGWIRHLLKYGS